MLATRQEITEIIQSDYKHAETFDKLSDYQSEIIDGIMPIYTSETIEEWREMPNDYTDSGQDTFGLPDDRITITGLMNLDLWNYYSDLVASVIWELKENGYFD